MTEYHIRTREEITRSDDARDAGLTTPDDIIRFDDLRYGEDDMQVLDIYCPKGTTAPLPTIVSVHGGGWIYGDKERYSHYCMRLARRGFTVVNFSYRLAPEHKYPAQIQDTCAVMHWLRSHAAEYPVDLNNLFMAGDSAGGQICFQFLTMLTNPKYAKKFSFAPPEDMTVRACALNCGCYYIPVSRFITPARVSPMVECLLPENYLPVASSLQAHRYVKKNFPPAFVMTTHTDFLKKMAPDLCLGFRFKGVKHELHIYGAKDREDIGHCFHLNCRTPEAAACNDDECAFFRRHTK